MSRASEEVRERVGGDVVDGEGAQLGRLAGAHLGEAVRLVKAIPRPDSPV